MLVKFPFHQTFPKFPSRNPFSICICETKSLEEKKNLSKTSQTSIGMLLKAITPYHRHIVDSNQTRRGLPLISSSILILRNRICSKHSSLKKSLVYFTNQKRWFEEHPGDYYYSGVGAISLFAITFRWHLTGPDIKLRIQQKKKTTETSSTREP